MMMSTQVGHVVVAVAILDSDVLSGVSAIFDGDVSPCILVIVNVVFGLSAMLYGDVCVIGR
jgi:hypothetical protein